MSSIFSCKIKLIPPSNKIKDEEEEDAINELQKNSNIYLFYYYPNLEFDWLSGIRGYVALIKDNKSFSAEAFNCDKYRVITVKEIDIKEFLPDKILEMQNIVRKCLPSISDFCQVDMFSSPMDGWNPLLGERSTSIGIYSSDFTDVTQLSNITRYFVCVNNSLPTKLINELQERDNDLYLKNLSAKIDGQDNVNIHTYQKEFNTYKNTNQNLNQNLINIQKENNKRLIHFLVESLDIPLIDHGDFKQTILDDLSRQVLYKIPEKLMNIYEKIKEDGNRDIKEELIKCLRWWPTGSIIYPFTYLKRQTNLLKDSQIEDEIKVNLFSLDDFPLGPALMDLYINFKNAFDKIINDYKVNFQLGPCTFNADIETEYNTFRVQKDDTIKWYSNTCPIDSDLGICVQHPNGFEVLNSENLCTSHVSNWDNDYGGGYPALLRFNKQEDKLIPPDQLEKFFTFQNGGKLFKNKSSYGRNAPKQLKGYYTPIDEEVRSHLYGGSQIKSCLLKPVCVFLSEKILENQINFDV